MAYAIEQAATNVTARLAFVGCYLDDNTTSGLTAFVQDTGGQPINSVDWFQRGSTAPLADPVTNVSSINQVLVGVAAREGKPITEADFVVQSETQTIGASSSHIFNGIPASDAGTGDTSKYIVVGESGPAWQAEFFGHKSLGTGTVFAGSKVTINSNTDPATGTGLDIWVDSNGFVNLTNNSGVSRLFTVIRIAD